MKFDKVLKPYYHEGLGLYLDVSRIGFDLSLLETLKPKFSKAFKDMEALEKGAIANPDENRMVGHYWSCLSLSQGEFLRSFKLN